MDKVWATQLFMTNEDEDLFSKALVAADPSIRFVDGQRWRSPGPPLVPSIADAASGEVFIWSPDLVPVLPTSVRGDGVVQGPLSGVVIQFERSLSRDSELRSGRIAAGYDADDVEMDRFVRAVWQVLRTVTSRDIEALSGQRHPFRIGAKAKQWNLAAPEHRLRDRSVKSAYFRARPK